jgi:hypothetical protein
MTRNRTICLVLALVLAALFASSTGCYDKGTREDCVGFSCPYGLEWPDGGEVRIWYIRLPDGTAIRRLMGFFHTSEESPPPFVIGECAPDPNVFQPAQRQYIDVGESLRFQLGDTSIDVPKVTPMAGMPILDAYFRQHEIAYLLDTPPSAIGDGFINGKHSVETADDGINRVLRDIYQPPRLTLTSPLGAPVITLKKGEDVLFTWETEDGQDPDAAVGMALVFVPDAMQIPTACIAGNKNEFLVPASIIDAFAADTGFVLVGTATAENELRDDGNMMGKWALTCQLVPWSRVE